MIHRLRVVWAQLPHLAKWLVAVLAVYGFLLFYFILNYLTVTDGLSDPIYQAIGLPRTEQLEWVSLAFLFVAGGMVITLVAAIPRGDAARIIEHRTLIVILALVFANAVTSSIGAVFADLNQRFWLSLYAWVFLGLLTQLALAGIALRFLPWAFIHGLLLAGLGTFSFYALNFSLAQWFRTGSSARQTFAFAAVFVLLMVLFSLVNRARLKGRTAAIVLGLMSIAPLVALAAGNLPSREPGNLVRFSEIAFASTPDIHIISVEALAPPGLVRAYLELDEVAYEEALGLANVHRFANAFATNVPTLRSLNSVMRLAQSDASPNRTDYFAGGSPSPLTTVLHANGYHITTGFPSLHMGGKGEHVDSYSIGPNQAESKENSTLCMLADASFLSFFGYCHIGAQPRDTDLHERWVEQIVDTVTRTDHDEPRFTYHHILELVGHTGGSYRTGNEQDRQQFRDYFEAQDLRAAELLRSLHDLFAEELDDAIVILTGDHGLWMSRTVSLADQPAFYVRDRHGIVLATFYNDTQCGPDVLAHYMSDYATPERLLGGLIRCLANDAGQVDAALDFHEPVAFEPYIYQ